jgi:hypothetical protein
MIVIRIPVRNGAARKRASRWVPEVSPGVFIGRVHPQGRARLRESLAKYDNVVIQFAPDKISEWRSGVS